MHWRVTGKAHSLTPLAAAAILAITDYISELFEKFMVPPMPINYESVPPPGDSFDILNIRGHSIKKCLDTGLNLCCNFLNAILFIFSKLE